LSTVGSRQYEEWQNLRHLDASSSEVALRIEKFCSNICRALEQPWLSPEERQQAEIRRIAEDERRRQEAEHRPRLDEAEVQKGRQDEERRRLEKVANRPFRFKVLHPLKCETFKQLSGMFMNPVKYKQSSSD
jgi:hypothetical protein